MSVLFASGLAIYNDSRNLNYSSGCTDNPAGILLMSWLQCLLGCTFCVLHFGDCGLFFVLMPIIEPFASAFRFLLMIKIEW